MTESKISPPLSETYDEVLRKIEKLDSKNRSALISSYLSYSESNEESMGFVMYADHFIEGEFVEYGFGLIDDLKAHFKGDLLAFNLIRRHGGDLPHKERDSTEQITTTEGYNLGSPELADAYDKTLKAIENLDSTKRESLISDYLSFVEKPSKTGYCASFIMYANWYIGR